MKRYIIASIDPTQDEKIRKAMDDRAKIITKYNL